MRIARNGMLLVAMAALVLAVSAPLLAQGSSLGMSVQIPFDFHVGQSRMPAGAYTVEKRGDALFLRDASGHNAFVLTNASPNPAPKGETQLVFNRYWDSYFLSEARWSGYGSASHLLKDSKEIAIAGNTTAQPVTVAALVK